MASSDHARSKTLASATLSSAISSDRLRDHSYVHRRPSSASPYYRGLTDSALYLKNLDLSPGRQSFTSSTRSSSSVLLLMQEWAPACFSKSVRKEEEEVVDYGAHATAWDPGLARRGSGGRRPLRESELAAATPPQLPAAVKKTAAAVTAAVDVVAGETGDGMTRKEQEFVWANKYRPRHLEEFICNRERAEELKEMVRKKQCSHLIFEGSPGVGKRTMALAFLRDALGSENLKIRNELRKIELKGEHITSIDVNLRVSSQHVEVNLSEMRGYEKHVLVSLINEPRAPHAKAAHCDLFNCLAIVVHEADKLSTDAQHYVCWLMEKYKGCNKIFFCCYDASKLETIKHLCKVIQLKQPLDSEIVEVLKFIAEKEHIKLPHHMAKKIAKNSKNNLRQAIRSLEASWKSNHSLKDENHILTGWEEDIANIANSIVKEQSPKQLYIIRGKLKKLIEHDVSPDFIFDTLISELKNLLDVQFHAKIDAMYQEYKVHDNEPISSPEKPVASAVDIQEETGNKYEVQRRNIHYFMKIEEFTAKFMSYYKSIVTKGSCC